MLYSGRQLASPQFFDYFFSDAKSISLFEFAVDRFRVKAMLLFANFRYAYNRLAEAKPAVFERMIGRTEAVKPTDYERRSEFNEIEPIEEDDLHLLGYVSGKRLEDLQFAVEFLRELPAKHADFGVLWGRLGTTGQSRFLGTLEQQLEGFRSESFTASSDWVALGEQAEVQLTELRARRERAIEIGIRNTARYLSMPFLDVYVATSMRDDGDYQMQHAFASQIFAHPAVGPLKLRYFDPTLSYANDRVTKGLIEGLMLRRARVTIYNAGDKDSLGKDCELATTLAQGKPVIVYVPSSMAGVSDEKLHQRWRTFRADHPLGLQIDVRSGVAHGVLVVREVNQCAEMLRGVLLRTLEYRIVHENGNYSLYENQTESVIRVVSDDPFLTHAFWTYFHESLDRSPEPAEGRGPRSTAAGSD